MPNSVFNRLAVSGPPDAVEGFRRRAGRERPGEEPVLLDFSRHVSQPEELAEAAMPAIDADSPAVREAGLPDWYWWRVENWGTKWNAYDVATVLDAKTGVRTYVFITAWSPPDVWLSAASSQHPELEFEHEFVEEMHQAAGCGRWRAGKLVDYTPLEPEFVDPTSWPGSEWEWDEEDEDGEEE